MKVTFYNAGVATADFKYVEQYENIGLWAYRYDAVSDPSSGMTTFREAVYPNKPIINILKNDIENDINQIVTDKITNGFIYEDIPVYLSKENQIDFMAAMNVAKLTNGSNLPITFLLSTGNYKTFSTQTELKNFVVAYTNYIQNCLVDARAKKDGIDYSVYK